VLEARNYVENSSGSGPSSFNIIQQAIAFMVHVEINVAITRKSKFVFDLGELVRQTDRVHT